MAYYKVSVAEILKDKPVNTKLYSPLFGDVYFSHVEDSIINVEHHAGVSKFFNSGRYYNYDESEPLLFPSMEMRDWSKFSWKKGDVLVCKDVNSHIIFDKFNDDTYTTFTGKLYYRATRAGYSYTHTRNLAMTQDFDIEEGDAVQTYIKTIEEKLGGKLNRETLEVEKLPEFKDGDIIKMTWDKYSAIVIFWEYSNFGKGLDSHVFFNIKTKIIEYNIHGHTLQDMILRFATEEEKQQLFDALAKKGKAWDAEKKMIVDLKPKYEFKPMDLCLMKYIGKYNNRGWELCQYAYTEHRVSSSGEQRDFYHAVGGEIYAECIPYKGNEHLLGTKKSK